MCSTEAGRPDSLRCSTTRSSASQTSGATDTTSASTMSASNDRAALMLMDYPSRRRLKIYAHAELREPKEDG